MVQVVYVQYGEIKVKRFSGEQEYEDALNFIDALRNHLFLPGGVVLAVTASEWKRTGVGERSERLINGTRLWVTANQIIDKRLDTLIENEFVQPCLHCDTWCQGKCRGASRCILTGKPGHTHCHSRLIEEGILSPDRKW